MVNLTDKIFMKNLHEEILEEYAQNMNMRIASRQETEMNRVKNLVLAGKIPLKKAPPEMANHPVMLTEIHCNESSSQRRIKRTKKRTGKYPLTDESSHQSSTINDRIFMKSEDSTSLDRLSVATHETEMENGHQFSRNKYVKQENPLIKQLRICETVEEMYKLADEIIGVLKTIDVKKEETLDNTT